MIITNAINSPFPTSLGLGGMNTALAASNGGIFYSTASAGAILSGTATANQTLMSGPSSAPTWSTATYLPSTNANELLYSPSDNAVGGLATASSACLISDTDILPIITSYPVWSLPIEDGQIIIGGTSGRPEPSNLISGNRIRIVNNPGSITINHLSGANWKWIATQTASSSTSLDFTNLITPTYPSYRIIVKNLLPNTNGVNVNLRFGYVIGYISDYSYIYQQCSISNDGLNNTYHGYNGGEFNLVNITFTNIHGISPDPIYGGLCGTIDLFVIPGNSLVFNGISRMSYSADSVQQYVNSICTFQLAEPFYYNSVQLFVDGGYNLVSGSASLYGLNTSN